MSKAEEKAIQHCCTNCTNNKLNCGMKLISHGRNCIACSNYIKGYEQAEKDKELTWKPSDEQIYALRSVVTELKHSDNKYQETIEDLYNDLEKLKGG